jgi:hypothetical protein
VNSISYSVFKTDVQEISKTITELQEKADSVTEDSATWEVKEAAVNEIKAYTYINCMRDLKLLPEPEYSKLFIRQLRIAEKIKALQEVRREDVCEDTR